MSDASAQGQMSEERQHATNPNGTVNGGESIVNVIDSVQNNDDTGNGITINNDGSEEGNAVNNVQNRDGARAASGDSNMRRSRSFDDEDVRDKRGWMMMVAVLFVQMAFQAALQPPAWIPADWYRQFLSYRSKHGAALAPSTIISAPSPSPHYAAADSPAGAISLTVHQADRIWWYVILNTITFATALTILVTLLLLNRSSGRHTVIPVEVMFLVLATTCSGTYILANTYEARLIKSMLTLIAVFALLGFYYCFPRFCNGLLMHCFTVPQRVIRRLFGR